MNHITFQAIISIVVKSSMKSMIHNPSSKSPFLSAFFECRFECLSRFFILSVVIAAAVFLITIVVQLIDPHVAVVREERGGAVLPLLVAPLARCFVATFASLRVVVAET